MQCAVVEIVGAELVASLKKCIYSSPLARHGGNIGYCDARHGSSTMQLYIIPTACLIKIVFGQLLSLSITFLVSVTATMPRQADGKNPWMRSTKRSIIIDLCFPIINRARKVSKYCHCYIIALVIVG